MKLGKCFLIFIFIAGCGPSLLFSQTRYGLMIGINNYDPAYCTSPLKYCINDAVGFRDCLLADSSLWSSGNITTLTDSGAPETAIRSQMSSLASAAFAGDLVVYYQASHGGQYSGYSCYLCSYNASYNDSELASDLSNFRDGVTVIIVLDTCHSEGMFRNANGKPVWNFARNVMQKLEKIKTSRGIRGPNVGWLTSCAYNQSAYESPPHGVFTGFVIEAFSAGSVTSDGKVTFKELFDYAAPRTTAEEAEQEPKSNNNSLLAATTAVQTGAPPSSYRIIADGNYNGDNYADIAIFRPSSGLWSVRGVTRVYWGASGDIPIPGDYDGHGTTRIGIFRPSSGLWAVRGYNRYYFGSSSDIPVPGDYTGTGRCNYGIFRPSSGLWAVMGITRCYFGSSSDKPVPADYSGDNTTEICIFRESNGLWACKTGTGWRSYFGSPGDIPVPIDTTGNGRCGPAIYRPSSGLWAVMNWSRCYFGGSSDQPVPADYQGGVADEIAIFRPSSGLWAIRGGNRYYHGTSGDIPVTR